MLKSCKLAITVPVYNEQPETLFKLLLSLTKQKKVSKRVFEIVIIVNNSKTEAEQKSKAFLVNQRLLNILQSLNKQSLKLEKDSFLKTLIYKKVKNKQLHISVIDSCSFVHAQEKNSIGFARNTACAFAVKEFEKIYKAENGLLATIDADCWVSGNYVNGILETFEQEEICALAGSLKIVLPKELPNRKLVKRALEYFLETKILTNLKQVQKRKYVWKQKADDLPYTLVVTGQNMVFTAKAWREVGGIPQVISWEDFLFGQKLRQLSGDTGLTNSYTVYTLGRASERAGLGSLGRKIQIITNSVSDYVSEISKFIYIPDKTASQNFFSVFFNEKNKIDEVFFKKILVDLNFNKQALNLDFSNLLNERNLQLSKTLKTRDFFALEMWILEHLYAHFPKVRLV